MRISSRVSAKVAILLQFAALIRCLAEYFRLKHTLGLEFTLARYQPFVTGGLVAALGALIAVLLYFAEKYAAGYGYRGDYYRRAIGPEICAFMKSSGRP